MHRDVLGADSHLISYAGTGEFEWVSSLPSDVMVFGGPHSSHLSLDEILEALQVKVSASPGERYETAWQEVRGGDPGFIKWQWVLPPRVFHRYVSELLDQLWRVLEEIDGTYYTQEFQVGRKLILELRSSKIDTSLLNDLMNSEAHSTVRSTLAGFKPTKGDMLDPPRYSRTASVTGRLTVKSGPNILTLRKDNRKIIKSRYPRGKVIQVDFVSLEPRVLLASQGQDPPRDIYSYIASRVFKNDISRAVVKEATLGAMFGISPRRFQETTQLDINKASDVLKEVKKFFNISSLGRSLKKEFSENGHILNLYGRKIFPSSSRSNVLVNNKVQSSGVDAALLGFSNFLEMVSHAGCEVIPMFIIHDSLVLDVKEKNLVDLQRIADRGVKISGFSVNFPLSVETVS